MKREAILKYLSDHKKEFNQKYRVRKIGLFGSFARGEESKSSDIDIFVDMDPDLFKLVRLKEQIEKDLKVKVDLIRKHKNLSPLFLKMIQRDIIYV
ncbi:MAG: nucleotidyltransferase family protein [Epsilonproteobacteria bacterium]|nr:nucleotidyltransferase family protein [Campylobacterota bacterium]